MKILVSDNAAVGNSWLKTVAFSQYYGDQGLADFFIMIFLENNHGKYAADMLFGQFRTKKLQSAIISLDTMLAEFEDIKNGKGGGSGFIINPLSSVSLSAVLDSFEYRTAPLSCFSFTHHNIHFTCTSRRGVKDHLNIDLKTFLCNLLLDAEGVVHISTMVSRVTERCNATFCDWYIDASTMKYTIDQ